MHPLLRRMDEFGRGWSRLDVFAGYSPGQTRRQDCIAKLVQAISGLMCDAVMQRGRM